MRRTIRAKQTAMQRSANMERPTSTNDNLRKVEATIKNAVVLAHPGVVFTDFWVEPRTSWYGDDMMDIWGIYDGDVTDLSPPTKPSLDTRIQDMLWDMGLEAAPNLRLVAKSDLEEVT